jgi:hypothetical protein
MNHAVRDFAARCRKFLEAPDENGIPRFERAASSLLEPEIRCRRDSSGADIPGTEYLVNAASIVSMLDLLAGYAYGKPRQTVDVSGDASIFNIVQVPAPLEDSAWERKAQQRLIPN